MAAYHASPPAAKSEAKQEINILSFDGGGSKGVMEVFILKDVFNFLTILQRDPAQLEFLLDSKTSLDTGDGRKKLRGLLDNCKNPIHPTEVFDFIVGTSVGSIIAFGLVGGKKSQNKRERVPMEVEEIILMFKDYAKKMFEKKVEVHSWIPWLRDTLLTRFLPFPSIPYSQDGLEECLIEHFGDVYLEGFPKPRGCVAGAVARQFFNTGVSGRMVIFTTKNKNDNYKVVDVLKASSAAPIYFQTPVKIGEDDYIDGGDGGNCPLAQALPAVKEIFGEDAKVSTVLSIAPPRTFLGPIPAENQWMYWLGYFPTQVTDGSSVYYRVSKYSPQDISFQRLFPKSDETKKFKMDEKNVDAMISCMEEESVKYKWYFTDIIQAALTITLRLDKPDNHVRRQICERLFNSSENEELALLWLKVAEHEVAPSKEIARIRRKLGDCYYTRSYYDRAIRCYQKSMEESDQSDQQLEDMAVLNNSIGSCYKAKNCYEEAINYFQKNLQLTTLPLVVAESYNHLADCHYNLGRVDLAITFYTKALDHIEAQKNLGQEASKFIAISYNGLGNCYLKENQFEKALEYYSKSMATQDAVDGISDVDKEHTSKALNNKGLCYLMTGRFSDAIENFTNSLDLEKEIHGRYANHPAIAISHTNLGNGYLAMGAYDKAIDSFTKSLDMNIKIYGKDSAILCMAETFNNLGICILKKPGELPMESLDKVVTYFKNSLHIKKTVYGKGRQQRSIAKTYNNLGRSLMEKHQYHDAIQKLNKSLNMKIQIFGDDPENKSIAITYTNFGECYQKMGDNSKAKDYFDKVKKKVEERLEEYFY